MTIDTANILTLYGLKLTIEIGLDDLPARKKILTDQGFSADDIIREALEPVLTLKGKYVNAATMITKIRAFETFLKSDLKHVFTDTTRGWSFTAVCKSFEGTYYIKQAICVIKMNLTITE